MAGPAAAQALPLHTEVQYIQHLAQIINLGIVLFRLQYEVFKLLIITEKLQAESPLKTISAHTTFNFKQRSPVFHPALITPIQGRGQI